MRDGCECSYCSYKRQANVKFSTMKNPALAHYQPYTNYDTWYDNFNRQAMVERQREVMRNEVRRNLLELKTAL